MSKESKSRGKRQSSYYCHSERRDTILSHLSRHYRTFDRTGISSILSLRDWLLYTVSICVSVKVCHSESSLWLYFANFWLVDVSKVITSDQTTCFTSQLTQEFIKLFGCSPTFSTALHPEGNSLVERINQTVKKMLHHVCQKDLRKWHKVLPLVLWTIKESKNETLGTSPHVIVFARTPPNPLKLIKEFWTGEIDLPLTL